MEVERIQELIAKYNAMTADPSELREIEQLIERGIIDISDLVELHAIEEGIESLETPVPSMSLDDKFHAMLQTEKSRSRPSTLFSWKSLFSAEGLIPKLSFASVLLMLGVAGGMFLRNSDQETIKGLTEEVSDMKEMMMLTMLEKESPTERLKAVSLTEEMDQASKKVTTALLQTLNNDENVNVRLAALDALRQYAQQGEVREALIRSITKQDSPLVQIALAELMAAMQAKSSVKELQKIVHDDNTPNEVKKKIQESIEVLS
ncbi:HEAT repeat domain-containing protein [Chryseolinea sp. T2]|uniref:HEAT repeat domain-containing protein n=1 Tax=Chryseolinea sp. T2 TaxID=3129255 RepID=UPI0030772D71